MIDPKSHQSPLERQKARAIERLERLRQPRDGYVIIRENGGPTRMVWCQAKADAAQAGDSRQGETND